MSLPLAALCTCSEKDLPFVASGTTIYKGNKVIATFPIDGSSSSPSCIEFSHPYLVVCRGLLLYLYRCGADTVTLSYYVQCPIRVLSACFYKDMCILSFISGDWGSLELATRRLKCHKGSVGIFFSAKFYGHLHGDTVLLALGSAGTLVELCLIDIVKEDYQQLAVVRAKSFPIFCLRFFPITRDESLSQHSFLMVVLSYKHAHVYYVALHMQSRRDSQTMLFSYELLDDKALLDNVSRLFSAYIAEQKLFLGDETGAIHVYSFLLSETGTLQFALCYKVRFHNGIVRDMALATDTLYSCGEDGQLISHIVGPDNATGSCDSLNTIAHVPYSTAVQAVQNHRPVWLNSTTIYLPGNKCYIIIYTTSDVFISDYCSALRIPLLGQKPNSFDHFVSRGQELIITVGYSVSLLYCFTIPLLLLDSYFTSVIKLTDYLREADIHCSLSISACHIIDNNADVIVIFVYIYTRGGAVVTYNRESSKILSLDMFKVSLGESPRLLNVITRITNLVCLEDDTFNSMGPLVSDIIRTPYGHAIIFVYTRSGHVQGYMYSSEGLYLLFPLLDIWYCGINRGKLYAHSLKGQSGPSTSSQKLSFSLLFLSQSGKVQFIDGHVSGLSIAVHCQRSTRSIVPNHSSLISWDDYVVLASRSGDSWAVTTVCPITLTFFQCTVSAARFYSQLGNNKDNSIQGTASIVYNKQTKVCNLLNYMDSCIKSTSLHFPVLGAKVLQSGWISGVEINCHAPLGEGFVCGAETGEVTLQDRNLAFIKVLYFCDASVRSIATYRLDTNQELILIGASGSMLIYLLWNSTNASVIRISQFPVRYVQPKDMEMDIRYTAILPYRNVFACPSLELFLVGISIGEVWLIGLVQETNYIYLLERRAVAGVPTRISIISVETEHVVVSATQGLVILSLDSSKLTQLAGASQSFLRLDIAYTKHVLSQMPIGDLLGFGSVITVKHKINTMKYGALVDCLVYNSSVVVLSDIGYICLYAFTGSASAEGTTAYITKVIQAGCSNGIVCGTRLAYKDQVTFMYVGWDRIPHFCTLTQNDNDISDIHIYKRSEVQVPLYNIHSTIYLSDKEGDSVVLCGSGLFRVSVPPKLNQIHRNLKP